MARVFLEMKCKVSSSPAKLILGLFVCLFVCLFEYVCGCGCKCISITSTLVKPSYLVVTLLINVTRFEQRVYGDVVSDVFPSYSSCEGNSRCEACLLFL